MEGAEDTTTARLMERLARVGGHVLTRTAAAAAQPPLETEDALLEQLCRECRKFVRPHRVTGKEPVVRREKKRHGHRSDLCVACIKGVCTVKNTRDPSKVLVESVIAAIGL